ncbi:MAG: hypothetical protein ACYC7D_13910 [Nitrososphaerales archaeon]
MNTTVAVTEASVTLTIDYAGQNGFPLIDQGKIEYRSCMNCTRHPQYPEVPAVTLHKGAQCTICNGRKPEQK